MIWFRPELRVLFVCTANVCRSPLAEGLLRHRLSAMGLAGKVQVRSAGTSVGQSGRRPDPRVTELASEAGISLGRIRARRLTARMLRRSDHVLVMERRHLEEIARLRASRHAGESAWPDNVRLLGSFLPRQGGEVTDIPDPYFGDLQCHYDVYQMIDMALAGFLAQITS
jgi:protein-tyrosine phosphatase